MQLLARQLVRACVVVLSFAYLVGGTPLHARPRKDMSMGGKKSSDSAKPSKSSETSSDGARKDSKSSSLGSKSASTNSASSSTAAGSNNNGNTSQGRFTIDSILPAPLQNGRHFYLQGMGAFSALPNLPSDRVGGGGAVGFQWNFLLWELRSTFETGKYGTLMALPSAAESSAGFTSASDSNSELNRVRSKNDRWSLLTINAGMGVHARLIPDWLPFISEKARFGIQYVLASDPSNSVSLKGFSYSWDAGLKFAFGTSSPLAFEFLWGYNSGSVSNKAIGGQAGRLPITWTTWSGALILWI